MEDRQERGILIVISGFSGAGKGTLMKHLIEKHDNYALSISMTTRQPRVGETDGKEYFFVSTETFESHIQEDKVIEFAKYCDNYYGTPREYVEEQMQQGKDVILEIEIQGAIKIKEKFPEALLLFITPPNAAELHKRLADRGTETAEVIEKRMRRAGEEAKGIEQYEYIVVNDVLDRCVEELHAIVEAAHHTPSRKKEFINHLREELNDLLKGE